MDSTGRLNISGGTLSGTVATALGFTAVTNTSAVSATGKTLTTTKQEYAGLDTKLADLGVTSSDTTFTVYDKYGNRINTYTLDNNDKISDFFAKLGEEGIDATISNGVITLTSSDGKFITGQLADKFGITSQATTQIINTTSSSTLSVNYTGTITATASSTFGDLGIITSGSLGGVISDKDGNVIINQTGGFDSNSTINDLFVWLSQNDIQASITSGVISLYSPSGNTLGGDIASALGITTVNKSSTTTTIGNTASSNLQLVFDTTTSVSSSTKFSEIIENFNPVQPENLIRLYDKDRVCLSTFTVLNDTTIQNFLDWANNNGVGASFSNGVINIVNTDGNYLQDVDGHRTRNAGSNRYSNYNYICYCNQPF